MGSVQTVGCSCAYLHFFPLYYLDLRIISLGGNIYEKKRKCNIIMMFLRSTTDGNASLLHITYTIVDGKDTK